MTPDVLIVGHIAKDITDDGWRAGGSVLYAAAQCSRLAFSAAIVTKAESEVLSVTESVPGEWHCLSDSASTTFVNRYKDGVRSQELLARAGAITADDVPAAWQAAPIVMLMPVFHDVEPEVASLFGCSATLLSLSVQGWLRELDITNVQQAKTPDGKAWQGADLLFVSDEDVADESVAAAWARYVPNIVMTRGRQGSVAWQDGKRFEVQAIASEEVDATGAGDVFATACTIRYHETEDLCEAMQFATAAAALSVRGTGIEAIGDREAIERLRMREAPATR